MKLNEVINLTVIKNFFHEYFIIPRNLEEEDDTVRSIKSGVEFKGATLWVLIFAIFVASLGLNVNSTAVIIGAMLISPLMGPIIGMGLAAGTYDFELLKKSFKNYLVATVFSIITATIYFLLTPLDTAQSEILARTSPTFYDVCIAFFGGLAGIVALGTRDKGNVIPGVAIATALMPPLCTSGFGLATGNWMYMLGALYLFFINTVFISLATFLGVHFMRFKKHQFLDQKRQKRVKQSIVSIIIITMCPAIYMTCNIVKETIFETAANNFISNEVNFANALVLDKTITYKPKEIKVVLMGAEVTPNEIETARLRLSNYGLDGTQLSIVQGNQDEEQNVTKLRSLLLEDFYKNSEEKLLKQQERISFLETQLDQYTHYSAIGTQVTAELKALYPQTASLAISQTVCVHTADTIPNDTITVAIVKFNQRPDSVVCHKVNVWLQARTQAKSFKLIVE